MFLFSTINYLKLCESYIYFIRKIKIEVNTLGKISVRANDKPGYLLNDLKFKEDRRHNIWDGGGEG